MGSWVFLLCLVASQSSLNRAFVPNSQYAPGRSMITTRLKMLDPAMEQRLESIRRSHQALTERLGDPDVIADASLLMKVMSDRSKSEDVVQAYEEVRKMLLGPCFYILVKDTS